MTLLHHGEDFEWHKVEIDLKSKYRHKHIGEPEKYPCKVESEYRDGGNGADEIHHNFIYQQEVVCSACGHKTIVWPEVEE